MHTIEIGSVLFYRFPAYTFKYPVLSPCPDKYGKNERELGFPFLANSLCVCYSFPKTKDGQNNLLTTAFCFRFIYCDVLRKLSKMAFPRP